MSETNKSLPDLSELISLVSANPKAMTMLASLLGGAQTEKPCSDGEREEREDKKEHDTACASFITDEKKRNKNEERRRLLLALKPFLSPERRQAVNTLLLVLEGLSLLSAGKEPPCT